MESLNNDKDLTNFELVNHELELLMNDLLDYNHHKLNHQDGKYEFQIWFGLIKCLAESYGISKDIFNCSNSTLNTENLFLRKFIIETTSLELQKEYTRYFSIKKIIDTIIKCLKLKEEENYFYATYSVKSNLDERDSAYFSIFYDFKKATENLPAKSSVSEEVKKKNSPVVRLDFAKTSEKSKNLPSPWLSSLNGSLPNIVTEKKNESWLSSLNRSLPNILKETNNESWLSSLNRSLPNILKETNNESFERLFKKKPKQQANHQQTRNTSSPLLSNLLTAQRKKTLFSETSSPQKTQQQQTNYQQTRNTSTPIVSNPLNSQRKKTLFSEANSQQSAQKENKSWELVDLEKNGLSIDSSIPKDISNLPFTLTDFSLDDSFIKNKLIKEFQILSPIKEFQILSPIKDDNLLKNKQLDTRTLEQHTGQQLRLIPENRKRKADSEISSLILKRRNVEN